MVEFVRRKFKEDIIFVISFIIAIITSLIEPPQLGYIDFKVLAALFNLMIIIAAFENLKVLDRIAIKILIKFNNKQKVSLAIIFLTFIAAMFITNDVALITFVPITIIISKKADFNPVDIIIFQTLAANIGSALTPMGNPQNLFLYSFYEIGNKDFLKITIIFAVSGLIWLCFLNRRIQKEKLDYKLEIVEISDKKSVVIYIILFLIIVASILRVIDYRIAFGITIITALFLDRKLFISIDYYLLATFICFFIIIGNLSSLELVRDAMAMILGNKYKVYISSIFMSQFISNVPAAILLSAFTNEWKAVLLGVNIGGMGTLIASLASVISYKMYSNEFKSESYFFKFHMYNFLGLTLFSIILIFLI